MAMRAGAPSFGFESLPTEADVGCAGSPPVADPPAGDLHEMSDEPLPNSGRVLHAALAGFSSGSTAHSADLAQYDSYSYTFTSAGAYAYFCAYHPGMKGTVTVTA